MVNIARVPWGGRNFESYGEDPFLAAELVKHSIRGAQKEGVIATVKHYVDNNQEYNRTTVSENVGMRAQFEIYYPAFKSAVDAGVGAVMCSYNLINNTYACENNETLNRDLKGRMGFQGFVMSDWGATHSTVQSANNGLDMKMLFY
jgi:beta-glucosidase